MVKSTRITRRTALGLIAAGGGLTAAETLGYTDLTGVRSVSVETAEDPNALLGIDAEDDIGELRGDDGAVDIAELVNNFDQRLDELDVTVDDIRDADDDILTADADPSFDLEPDQTASAEVACAEDERVGERDVQFGVEATGSSVIVSDATFVVTIDIQCQLGALEPTASGLEDVSASDLVVGESDQTQTFDARLSADLPSVEALDISVEGASGAQELDYSEATYEADPPGTITPTGDGNEFVITFTPDEFVEAGETIEITASGVDASGNAVDDQYDVFFQRTDFEADEQTQFAVT